MPIDIVMPKLGLTMSEGTIIEWKKQEGEQVKADEILFVLETEKVVFEVKAPEDGVLGKILVQAGEAVPVGALVAYLLKPGETEAGLPSETPASKVVEVTEIPLPTAGPPPRTAERPRGRAKATPLAKKLAQDLGVDLQTLVTNRPSGRLVANDLRQAATEARSLAETRETEARLVPFSGMRSTIARNMMAAKLETAQTYMSIAADASAIVRYREELLPYVEEKCGARLTITDLLMKITGEAITLHPVINTRWTEEGIQFLPDVHMGMAMALDFGLIVPVIRNINSKKLSRIALDRTELIRKGRENKFLPDDIKGSTFTLSTLGMFGIDSFTANINMPESAILAVGAITDQPVAVNGQIEIRPMVNATLTYDHRIIDGAEAGKFMRTLKMLIEKPVNLLA